MSAATLFEWLHGAEFYRQFHRDAANLLPKGAGRTWLDIGCGPGVLSHEAALRDYRVRAVDRKASMIGTAIRQSQNFKGLIEFAVSDLDAEAGRGIVYDVVSASSLLTVLSDPKAGLAQLAALAKQGGAILIIEASHRMTPVNAMRLLATHDLGARSSMLLVWATARIGRIAPPLAPLDVGLTRNVTPLLDGLVEVSVLRKRQA